MENIKNAENAENADNKINNDMETFICDCGCGLIFQDYEPGCDIYIGKSGIISQYQMVSDYCWGSYIPQTHKQWYKLKSYIIAKYENCKNNDEEESKGWIHLYNRYCLDNNTFNDNDYIDYEYVY
jgi:hypothetical protein